LLSLRAKRSNLVESPAAMLKKLLAASAPQAGHFILVRPRKSNQKEGRPGAA
jgi:hypothetical protein